MPGRVRAAFEFVKFAHTIFALPFAFLSAFIAASGVPPPRTMGLILLAMVGARTGAMAVNRLVDFRFDAQNPRTAKRPLVTGEVSRPFAILIAIAGFAALVSAAAMLNPLALALSPVAIAILALYSLTKRFTWASHLFLGLALAGAPLGAWIAVTGSLAWSPVVLGAAVFCWVAGFDIIYACQDVDFDRRVGLHSIPERFGLPRAMGIAKALHATTAALLLALPLITPLGFLYFAGALLVAGLLFYEHRLVGPTNLHRLNEAFFTVNGAVSIVLFVFGAIDLALFT